MTTPGKKNQEATILNGVPEPQKHHTAATTTYTIGGKSINARHKWEKLQQMQGRIYYQESKIIFSFSKVPWLSMLAHPNCQSLRQTILCITVNIFYLSTVRKKGLLWHFINDLVAPQHIRSNNKPEDAIMSLLSLYISKNKRFIMAFHK